LLPCTGWRAVSFLSWAQTWPVLAFMMNRSIAFWNMFKLELEQHH
jgi:hypothetical protein